MLWLSPSLVCGSPNFWAKARLFRRIKMSELLVELFGATNSGATSVDGDDSRDSGSDAFHCSDSSDADFAG